MEFLEILPSGGLPETQTEAWFRDISEQVGARIEKMIGNLENVDQNQGNHGILGNLTLQGPSRNTDRSMVS